MHLFLHFSMTISNCSSKPPCKLNLRALSLGNWDFSAWSPDHGIEGGASWPGRPSSGARADRVPTTCTGREAAAACDPWWGCGVLWEPGKAETHIPSASVARACLLGRRLCLLRAGHGERVEGVGIKREQGGTRERERARVNSKLPATSPRPRPLYPRTNPQSVLRRR